MISFWISVVPPKTDAVRWPTPAEVHRPDSSEPSEHYLQVPGVGGTRFSSATGRSEYCQALDR